ncbi:flagellar hook-length control protein FliK [Aquabacterium sp. A7-Y]|uniref:flagellar hook-length control protein FliK n=1 Tax=Aquabacterium sp. A7-Y TaxID=1349605 RepID=UPI00223D8E03|nr:flagellar hook-length control protein FliK [Aquabacterium sp. A7-Y]MCW7536526.1 flagellar hook-length control protein FliK [Aquabacterium sp. A7-Y]
MTPLTMTAPTAGRPLADSAPALPGGSAPLAAAGPAVAGRPAAAVVPPFAGALQQMVMQGATELLREPAALPVLPAGVPAQPEPAVAPPALPIGLPVPAPLAVLSALPAAAPVLRPVAPRPVEAAEPAVPADAAPRLPEASAEAAAALGLAMPPWMAALLGAQPATAAVQPGAQPVTAAVQPATAAVQPSALVGADLALAVPARLPAGVPDLMNAAAAAQLKLALPAQAAGEPASAAAAAAPGAAAPAPLPALLRELPAVAAPPDQGFGSGGTGEPLPSQAGATGHALQAALSLQAGPDAVEAAAAPAQGLHTRQPGSTGLAEVLGERLRFQLASGSDRAVIRLDPPMMGSIEIVIRHEAGGLQVQMSATHGEVARQLQAIGDTLRQDLVQRQYGEVSVVVVADGGARDRDAQGRQGREQGQPQQPGRGLAEESDEGRGGFGLADDGKEGR